MDRDGDAVQERMAARAGAGAERAENTNTNANMGY
jgi:hypothetical protein